MKAFDFRSMQTLKLRAKACKETHPHLSQAKRLDLVAQRDFGCANFNEARKRRQADIDQHVELEDGLSKCKLCRFSFVEKVDRREHNKRHERYEEAICHLGFTPLEYRRREDLKAASWNLVRSAESAEQQAKAYLGIFRAWFYRSLEAAIENNDWRKHPDFPVFVSMMLPAYEMPAEPRAYLAGLYGERPGYIKPGSSYWRPQYS